MPHALVTGGTGFIGAALCRRLDAEGWQLTVLTRDPASVAGRTGVAAARGIDRFDALADGEAVDAVINLAGEPIADGRWTARRRVLLRDSRTGLTRELVSWLGRLAVRPQVLVSGSAIGYYGDGGDQVLQEDSPSGQGVAASLCREWEAEALPAADRGLRVCLLRTGVVLHPEGGALARMLPPFRLGLGGPIGHGRQWLSWIHRDDLVDLVMHLLARDDLSGPFNGTAPNPVTSREFARTLGAVLHRPAVLPVPAAALRLGLGEAAGLLLDSQRVMPSRALASGFVFRYPDLRSALAGLR